MTGSIALRLPGDYTETKYPDLARKQIVAAFAGPTAEIRASGDLDIAAGLGEIDEIMETAAALAGSEWAAMARECQEEVRALVTEHWAAIERVAIALTASHEPELDSAAVSNLITAG